MIPPPVNPPAVTVPVTVASPPTVRSSAIAASSVETKCSPVTVWDATTFAALAVVVTVRVLALSVAPENVSDELSSNSPPDPAITTRPAVRSSPLHCLLQEYM